MIVTPIKTERVTPASTQLLPLLKRSLPQLGEGSVVVITSKIVSLCEGRTVPIGAGDREALIKQESDFYTDPLGIYGFHFTLTNNTFIPAAGIDESNSDGTYVLWPANVQETANEVWHALREHFGITQLGVVITDSTCKPLRRGTGGVALAHCGFEALRDYIGQPDLFDRPIRVSQANVAEGIAASAVLVMGEGAEQTPLCIVEDLPQSVTFKDRPPTADEHAYVYVPLAEDIFAPIIQAVDWHKGGRGRLDNL